MRHALVVLLAAWLATLALAGSARADLVTMDLLGAGDGLVTRDTDSGLDWLDLPGLTTGVSYDAIQGGAGGWIAGGWRYATQAEVCRLWTAHGGAPSCNFTSGILSSAAAVMALMTLLGTTENLIGTLLVARVDGVYDDATAPSTSVGFARIELSTPIASGVYMLSTSASANAVASSSALATRGSFLVRATPPAVPALPVPGAALLAAAPALGARGGVQARRTTPFGPGGNRT